MYKKYIIIVTFINLLIGLLYLPNTPWYVLNNLYEFEIFTWAVIVILLSILLGIAVYKLSGRKQGMILILLITIILTVMHLGAGVAYQEFIPEGMIGESPMSQATPSIVMALAHCLMFLLFISVLIIEIIWLRKVIKQKK